MVPINRTETGATERPNQCRIKKMALAESSPEKAGVGGSTPSLATIVFKQLAGIIETPSVSIKSAIGCASPLF